MFRSIIREQNQVEKFMKEEREAAVFNVYDYIIEAFKQRFCIMIY